MTSFSYVCFYCNLYVSDKEITLFASWKAIPNLFQQVIYTCERLEVPLIWYNCISEAKGNTKWLRCQKIKRTTLEMSFCFWSFGFTNNCQFHTISVPILAWETFRNCILCKLFVASIHLLHWEPSIPDPKKWILLWYCSACFLALVGVTPEVFVFWTYLLVLCHFVKRKWNNLHSSELPCIV